MSEENSTVASKLENAATNGLLTMAVDGVAIFAADTIRDGLNRLIGKAKPTDELPGRNHQAHLLLLAIAAAAVVVALTAGRNKPAKDVPAVAQP